MQVKFFFLIFLLISLKMNAPFADYFDFSLTKKSQPDQGSQLLTEQNMKKINRQTPKQASAKNRFSVNGSNNFKENSKKTNTQQVEVANKVNKDSFYWFTLEQKNKSNPILENQSIKSDTETLSSSSSKETVNFDLPISRQVDTNQFLSMKNEKSTALPNKVGDDIYNRVLYGTGGGKYSYNTLAKSVPQEVKQLVQDLTGNQLPDLTSIDGKAQFNGGYWRNGDKGGMTVQVTSVPIPGKLPVVAKIEIFGPQARVITIAIDQKTKMYEVKKS